MKKYMEERKTEGKKEERRKESAYDCRIKHRKTSV